MKINYLKVVIFMSVVLLGGCKEDTDNTNSSVALAESTTIEEKCEGCGSVIAIESVSTKGDGSGAGVVLGAVVGGLLGHQIGGGSGKDVATVVGAVGGAFAGNEIEKQSKSQPYYNVTVGLDNGRTRVVSIASTQLIAIGTPVKVVGNNLEVL